MREEGQNTKKDTTIKTAEESQHPYATPQSPQSALIPEAYSRDHARSACKMGQ